MKTSPTPAFGDRSSLAFALCLTAALGACSPWADTGPDFDVAAVEELIAVVEGNGVALLDETGRPFAPPDAQALRFSMALADVSPDEIFVAFLEDEGFARSPDAEGLVVADRVPWRDGQVFHRVDVSAVSPLAMALAFSEPGPDVDARRPASCRFADLENPPGVRDFVEGSERARHAVEFHECVDDQLREAGSPARRDGGEERIVLFLSEFDEDAETFTLHSAVR